MRNAVAVALCGALIVSIAAGCKSQQPATSQSPQTGSYEEPVWVSRQASAFPAEAGKSIYGVGVAEKKLYPDIYLRRANAEDRARESVARQLQVFVDSVIKDYIEAAFTPSMDQAEMRNLTSAVRKSVASATLVGCEIVDHWTDPSTGDIYALVRLSKDSAAEQLRSEMTDVEKGRLHMDADQAHEELDQIIQKRRMIDGT